MTHAGRQRSRRTYGLVTAVVVLVVGAGVSAVVVPGLDGSLALPDRVAGLPSAPPAPGPDDQAQRLVDRLRAQPTVAEVGLGRYGGAGSTVVVLQVLPREPFTEETAGRLTAQLFTALEPRRGPASEVESDPSEDGLALVSCGTTAPGASTCVSVEPAQALLVLATGWDGDPLRLTEDVRDDLGPAPSR